MILNRFFKSKPKWQHANPQIRKQALETLDASDPVVIQLAREDRDSSVRQAALERITDLELLQQIACEDPGQEIRGLADERFRRLMAGKEPDGPSLEARLTLFAQTPALGLADFIALHAQEPALRLASLKYLQEPLLAELVIKDPVAEVRAAALERIQDTALLEQIYKQSRNRDKRLNRKVRERLNALQAEAKKIALAQQLCAQMETLAEKHEPDRGRFLTLDKAWEEQASADDSLQARYQQAREQVLAHFTRIQAARNQRRQIKESLESLLAKLKTVDELPEELAAEHQEILASARTDWNQAGTANTVEQQHFEQLIQDIKAQERLIGRDHERAQQQRQLLKQADTLLHQTSEVQDADLQNLQRRWSGLHTPEAKSLAAEMQARFETIMDRLRSRLRRQAEQKDQELEQIQTLISDLEEALEQGILQQAIALRDQARRHLKQNISLSRSEMTNLEKHLQANEPRIRELRGWRRWGTNQAREHLCEEAEKLLGAAIEPPELARQIRQLRDNWKHLDGSGGIAPKALWKRFDTICEKAYQPCQDYFDAQTRERQNNLEQRQALCERLEAFQAATDWAEPDWAEADRFYRQTQDQWHKIGPVNRADKKAIDQRYKRALRRLDGHLETEREQELQRRQTLIRQVQDLLQEDDLHIAINGAKQAQAQWSPSVQANRRTEQALWREFRNACDAIFQRRQAQQQAMESQRQTHLEQKTILCEELESLTPEDDPEQTWNRAQQIQQTWESTGPVPKAALKAIEQRFTQAWQHFQQRYREQQLAAARHTMQGLAARAVLCTRIEAALYRQDNDIPSLIEQTRQDWETLPVLQNGVDAAIQQRLDKRLRSGHNRGSSLPYTATDLRTGA